MLEGYAITTEKSVRHPPSIAHRPQSTILLAHKTVLAQVSEWVAQAER